MAKYDVDYPKLAEMLNEMGVYETRENLANKINRGKFSFAFALQIFEVLGCKKIDILNKNIQDKI